MFERIIVPLDGSVAAEMVLPYVVEETANFASDIFLVRVTESSSPVICRDCGAYLDTTAQQLSSMLESWGVKPGTNIKTQLLTGNPAIEILKYAAEIDARLIAVASRGASGAGPWPLGNIAAKILRASSIPVLLIRNPATAERLREKKLVKKILAPLDGSKLGEAAMPLVTGIADKTGAEIVLFRVVEPATAFAGPTGEVAWNFLSTYEANARVPVVSYLEQMKTSMSGHYAVSSGMGEGPAAGEIIDYARLNGIDLIAMSTHGRSGIGRWVYGSVAEKVLHSGEEPVLVVRPKNS
jgi:nucleotide-binding universal stress UspA family protein